MEFFTDEVMRGLLANSLETAALGDTGFYDVGKGPGSDEAAYIDWLTIADRNKSVVEDVTRIRRHPLVPKIFLSTDMYTRLKLESYLRFRGLPRLEQPNSR